MLQGKYFRYYNMEYLLLDTDNTIIKTEAQLAYYIYRKYGTGRYLIAGFMKGHKGFFRYWLGDILDNGFIRDRDSNREMNKLKVELNKASSYEEREMVEDEMDLERELYQEEKKTKRKGPYGIIKSSPSGVLHQFQEIY